MTNQQKILDQREFGYLVALSRVKQSEFDDHRARWLCRCVCGKELLVREDLLANGNTNSCGCMKAALYIEKTRKSEPWHHPLHQVWSDCKQRCYNPNQKSYYYYGSRGIIMYDKWKDDYLSFFNWCIENGWELGLELDRIDVNGNYKPENCRFVTHAQQMRNTRRNKMLTFNGETHCLSEWAAITGIPWYVMGYRLRRGWDINRIFTEPVHYKNQKTDHE